MVLVYFLPTKLGDFVWANVGKYSSTIEHLGKELTHEFQGFDSRSRIARSIT